VSDLPINWLNVELSDVAQIIRGVTYKREQSTDSPSEGALPVLRATNITGAALTLDELVYVPSENISNEQILRPGDVVIASSSGSKEIVGKAGAFVGGSFVGSFGAFCTGLRPSAFLSPAYFGYYFQTRTYRKSVSELSAGSNINNLKTGDLASQNFPLPPAPEQARIVAKLEELLSDLDAGVAELKAAQKKLAQYRQSLLKAAVEGALTAAWRTQHQPTETGAQLLQRILQERRARWEARQLAKFAEQGKTPPKDWQKKYPEPVQPDTSGLPELPQGWVWATAEMLFSWGSGDFLPASAQIDGDYPVYGGNGINGRHNAANVGHATIVIGRVGAHCGNVFRTESAAWVTDNAIYATAKNEFITWAHSELTMQAANLGSGSKGGAQPFISQKILNDTFIALPPIREQERILEEYVVALNSNEEMAASIAISLQQSTAQRQNILRAAFSGQLVPQDPHDEPASALLERIRAERAAQGAVKKPRGRKAKEAA
jgi:type I restriction enzyme S subunit